MSDTKKIEERQKLIDKVAEIKPDYFIFHDYSRFSRNFKTALGLKDELHDLGVCLWSMQTGIKSLREDGKPDPTANLIFTQLLAVYEMENKTRRESIKRGLRKAVANGKKLGRPKGSTIDKLKKYSWIVKAIREEEAKRLSGVKDYLSVRKLASHHKKPKSLIIELRKLLREQEDLAKQEMEILDTLVGFIS